MMNIACSIVGVAGVRLHPTRRLLQAFEPIMPSIGDDGDAE